MRSYQNILRIICAGIFCILSFSISAQINLIPFDSNWNYYDNGDAPSGNWTDIGYDDAAWGSGDAQLGYGDNDENTPITNGVYAAYFRHSFNLTDPSEFVSLDLSLVYDDGAVIYLNGVEVWRVNMPTGPIDYGTFSDGTSGDNATQSINLASSLLAGENVLAVEVHQASANSSDISFNFELIGQSSLIVSLIRGPYLQKAHEDKITVKWRTNHPGTSVVYYGTDLNNLNQSVSSNTLTTEHEILVTGLAPATQYYYTIGTLDEDLLTAQSDLYFKTHPTLGSQAPIRAWVLGDCGTANNNARAVRDAYYTNTGTEHTDMILFLGDNAYGSGTDEEYQYAIFENMYEEKLQNSVAWSCLGNHDGHSADSQTQTGPYYDIFSFPTNAESGGIASGTEAYYSFDYGNLHVISLDSHETDRSVGGTMYDWLETDLQNTSQEWIVAIWHHPAYTKGSHDSDTESKLVQMRENFLPLLESYGVDLVLSGHSHSYERSFYMHGHYGDSDSFNAAIHTVGDNGSGDGKIDGNGAYLKNTNCSNGANYITAGSSGKTTAAPLDHEAMIYSDEVLGSCIIEINGPQMDVKFLRETGVIDDYYTVIKELDDCTVPDLSPEIVIGTQNINGQEAVNLVIEINELLGNASDGPVSFVIAKDTYINFNYDSGLSNLSGLVLDNAVWTYDASNPDYHIFTSSASINGGGVHRVGLEITYDPLQLDGQNNLTVQVLTGSGAELNFTNNSTSVVLNYLHF